MVVPQVGPAMIIMSFVGVIAASGLGNYLRARPWLPPNPEGKTGSGITTEMAILVMFAVGVYLAFGPAVIAISVTGVVVLLLYAKKLLHRFVDNLGEKDVHAIMQFVLLAFIILPILPDRNYGPYSVINPRHIWMVVVLVVGISLGGYILYKVVGERAGTVLSGILGGLISSTATTVTFARRTKAANGGVASSATLAIMLASAVVYGRLFIELSAVAPKALLAMAVPMGAMGAVTFILAMTMYIAGRTNRGEIPAQENPTNLKSAFFFAAIYGAIVLASAAAQERFWQQRDVRSGRDFRSLGHGRDYAVDGAEHQRRADPDRRGVADHRHRAHVEHADEGADLRDPGEWRVTVRVGTLMLFNIAAGILIVMYWPPLKIDADAGKGPDSAQTELAPAPPGPNGAGQDR